MLPPHTDDVCTDFHILWDVEGRRVEGRGRVKEVVEEMEKELKEVEENIMAFNTTHDKLNTVFAMDIQKRECILNHQELIKEKLLSDGK